MYANFQSKYFVHIYSNFASLLEYHLYTNLYVPPIKPINELNEHLFPMSLSKAIVKHLTITNIYALKGVTLN